MRRLCFFDKESSHFPTSKSRKELDSQIPRQVRFAGIVLSSQNMAAKCLQHQDAYTSGAAKVCLRDIWEGDILRSIMSVWEKVHDEK